MIRDVFTAVLRNIDRSESVADRLAYQYQNQKVLIGEATIGNGGVCRHFGIIIATILERLIAEGYLNGRAYYVRGPGHGWAVYETSGGEFWVLDAMQRDQICSMETESFYSSIGIQPYKKYFPKEGLIRRLVRHSVPAKSFEGGRKAAKVSPDDNARYRLKANSPKKVSYKRGAPIIIKAASKEFQILSYKDLLINNPTIAKKLNPDIEYYLIDPGNDNGFKAIRNREEIVLGRDSPGRFSLTEDVSRMHFKIKREKDKFIIQDLDSTNGTFIYHATAIIGAMHEELLSNVVDGVSMQSILSSSI